MRQIWNKSIVENIVLTLALILSPLSSTNLYRTSGLVGLPAISQSTKKFLNTIIWNYASDSCVVYDSGASPAEGQGGQCPSDFRFCPPDFFLAPPTVFLWDEEFGVFGRKKRLKVALSARKSLRISAKTFFVFFFGDHLLLVGKFVISARKSLLISAKTFAPLI